MAANDTAARIVFFDLGLTLDQAETMQEKLSAIQGDSSFTRAEYRHFIYGDDADLFKNLAKFAWKPAIMGSVMEECGGPVLWLDAGNIVHQYLKEVRSRLTRPQPDAPSTTSFSLSNWMLASRCGSSSSTRAF